MYFVNLAFFTYRQKFIRFSQFISKTMNALQSFVQLSTTGYSVRSDTEYIVHQFCQKKFTLQYFKINFKKIHQKQQPLKIQRKNLEIEIYLEKTNRMNLRNVTTHSIECCIIKSVSTV